VQRRRRTNEGRREELGALFNTDVTWNKMRGLAVLKVAVLILLHASPVFLFLSKQMYSTSFDTVPLINSIIAAAGTTNIHSLSLSLSLLLLHASTLSLPLPFGISSFDLGIITIISISSYVYFCLAAAAAAAWLI
jgi:hypothetical protein